MFLYYQQIILSPKRKTAAIAPDNDLAKAFKENLEEIKFDLKTKGLRFILDIIKKNYRQNTGQLVIKSIHIKAASIQQS